MVLSSHGFGIVMVSNVCRLLFSLILLSGVFISSTHNYGSQIDEGIRIDVPTDGRVLIENRYGHVDTEIWDRAYVSVAATFETTLRSGGRSPILIHNRGRQLAISVFRAPNDPPGIVGLKVRVPQGSHLEIVTTKGRISLQGIGASVSLKSSSGDIESAIPSGTNMSINARALKGSVTSSLRSSQPSPDSHFFQTRLGTGAKQFDAQTDTGHIVLSETNVAEVAIRNQEPRLIGANSETRPAGTPSTSAQGDQLDEGDVIRVDSQLVSVNMSVVDMSTNRGLTGLMQSDFKLFENGEEQRIVQFESSTAPFDLILLIDVSGSTKEKIKLMRDAALRFVNAARPADRIGIVTFAGVPTVVATLTADRTVLRERVNGIDTARGDTKLYDSTMFAMNKFVTITNKSRRTAIVVISDGLDGTIPGVSDQIGSQATYRETLDQIREFDGVVYTLWLNTRYLAMSPRDTQPEAFDEAYDRMREMADAGGGLFYEVNRLEDLAGAYERVVTDLGTVYSLAYEPVNKARDGKWRAIRIRVNRTNAVARGKRGYYAN